MKILQISSAKTFGGGERRLIDLCRGLKNRGHEVFVALRPTCEWRERLDFLPEENILRVSIRNSFGIFSAKKIAGFVRAKNVRIIHAHVARDYLPAGLACRIAKTPNFVLTRHVLFPVKPFYKFALNNAAKAIAVSNAVGKNLREIFPAEKIVVIPNGIDIENWANRDREKLFQEFRFFHNIPFDAPLVGTIGELIILKGQSDFVLAANEIAKKIPGAHFVIIGKDNSYKKDFRGELKRLVKIFGLEDRFLFLDWVEDTAPLLAALDVFVSASHSESFGLAILEAMASGKAIVATATGGAKELIENEKSGKVVAIKEPLEIARAVEEFLSDEKMCEISGKTAQITAEKKFSLENMIERTERVYQSISD